MMEVRLESIRTFTGLEFFPASPRAEDVCIEDIAHALAFQCRFGGHCHQFFSVAQHAVRVSYGVEFVAQGQGLSPEAVRQLSLAGLLHDASEAYLVDVPRPVKHQLTNYKEMEDAIMRVIAVKYHFDWPLAYLVKVEDDEQLWAEMRDLFPNDVRWRHRIPRRFIQPVHCLSGAGAEQRFLERFQELMEGAKA